MKNKKNTEKKRTEIIISIFLLCCMFSCVSKKTDQKKLVFVAWGSAEETVQIRRWIRWFEKENAGIKVQLIHAMKPKPYLSKVLSMLAAGSQMDVLMCGTGAMGSIDVFLSKNSILPLNSYLNENKRIRESLMSEALENMTRNGKLYAVPNNCSPIALFYNRDIFKKNGLSEPNSDWTWDECFRVAKKLAIIKGQSIERFGIGGINNLTMALAYGEKIFSDDRKKFLFGTGKGALPAYKKYWKAVADKYIFYGYNSQSYGNIGDIFLSERMAMRVSGPWACQHLIRNNAKFKWDMSFMPKGNRRVSSGTTIGFSITKNAKYPKEAWKLIKFLVSAKVLKGMAVSAHGIPTVLELKNKYMDNPTFDFIKNKNIFYRAIREYDLIYQRNFKHPQYYLIKDKITMVNDALNNLVIQNKAVPEEYIKNELYKMNKEVNRLLEN